MKKSEWETVDDSEPSMTQEELLKLLGEGLGLRCIFCGATENLIPIPPIPSVRTWQKYCKDSDGCLNRREARGSNGA